MKHWKAGKRTQAGERQKRKETDGKTAMRVSSVSIGVNLGLSLLKLLAGIIGHSGAMLSDAVHSASDVLSTLVVIAGVKLSEKKSDPHHPYGHERMECVAAILLAAFLTVIGTGICIGSVEKIMSDTQADKEIPQRIALIAAVVSILVKEWMYWYTRAAARRIHSGVLMADAWHHRSDSLSSIGAFIGILGARMGVPILDPAAGLVISFFIVKASYDIFKDAVDKMVDRSCDDETVIRMRRVIGELDGVKQIDMIHTRLFGARVYVDIEIAADGRLSLWEAHQIAQNVHDKIEGEFPLVKHCMVHVNPI